MKTKKTLEFLQSGEKSNIQSLIDKVQKIATLDEIVKSELSSPLREHCRIANLRQGKLIIQADSPVWGSKLRFELTTLLSNLRKQPRFASLAGIDFFVAPFPTISTKESEPSHKKTSNISSKHRQLLRETADKVSDPKLKAVLKAIAEKEWIDTGCKGT